MPVLQMFDRQQPSGLVVVDPRDLLTLLGERGRQASWRVSGVTRYDEDLMIVGDEAAQRLYALSLPQG